MVAAEYTHKDSLSAFFQKGIFYVEERRGRLAATGPCTIFDEAGQPIGSLTQHIGLSGQIWRVFLKPQLLPFHFEITDTSGRTLASIRRGWTIFKSRTEIINSNREVIGFLKHKYRARKPRFKIFNAEGRKISEISGNRGTWDMDIIDRDYHPFGQIVEHAPESTPGATRNKDTYHITLNREVLFGTDRTVTLVAAVAIDCLLRENM